MPFNTSHGIADIDLFCPIFLHSLLDKKFYGKDYQ
jgi:hypothetical protein